MKHQVHPRVGQVRKFNKFLTKLAKQTSSPQLKALILARKINNKLGHVVQKGN